MGLVLVLEYLLILLHLQQLVVVLQNPYSQVGLVVQVVVPHLRQLQLVVGVEQLLEMLVAVLEDHVVLVPLHV